MPWAAIISLIMVLLSYFGSKKAGASDTTAALVGAAAGLGTYYVATETEWGQDIIKAFDGDSEVKTTPVLNEDGTQKVDDQGRPIVTMTDKDGKTFTGVVVKDPSTGNPILTGTNADGSVFTKLIDTVGKTLKDWGPTGTATVIGTTAVASKLDSKWLVWGGLAVLALIVLK